MFQSKRFTVFIALASLLGVTSKVSAREDISNKSGHRSMLKTTAGCQPATAAIDMQLNNVRARYMTGGDMWWNIGESIAEYEVPKGSGKSSQFAASCWIGGIDAQHNLKVAAQTYRQTGNDYWPGILTTNGTATIDQQTCAVWDNFWMIDKTTINDFIALTKTGQDPSSNPEFATIYGWPARGNAAAVGANNQTISVPNNADYAPFVDLNHDGQYEPHEGEYPDIVGDEYLWWVFNDAGNVKEQSLTQSIGIEVQTHAFEYATQDFLNDATFCDYKVINRGSLTLDSTYIAVWDDCDLGYAFDDYIGCDTTRGLGIQYNGTNDDGASGGHPVNSYGLNPPQVGLDFFQGPVGVVHRQGKPDTTMPMQMTNFTYYNNDFSNIGNPNNGVQIYYYMTGSILTGQRFSDDFKGAGVPTKGYGSGPISHYVYWGDPSDNTQWSECSCNNLPNDRRFIFSSGPFTLQAGVSNDITFGCIWAPGLGGCPNTNFHTITAIDDQAQELFNSNFATIEGPEAPILTVRELDRKLIFYITNPPGSNNYREQYGRVTNPDSMKKYDEASAKAHGLGYADSLYQFQGYRVFQLANSQVSAAQIFNTTTGEVDPSVASEVFECDIHDSITRIINYVKNTTVSDTTWIPQIKVNGKDSGIVHSFEITGDQFAPSTDTRLVNYHDYFFVAVAYAYNDFTYDKVHKTGGFNPRGHQSDSTQDQPYLGSSHGPNGAAIAVVDAMPNPSNTDMGTIINSDYNTGVIVSRIEGMGNGGNDINLDSTTENLILNNGFAQVPTYAPGGAPINVKVVDPVKVIPANWQLFIKGPEHGQAAASLGVFSNKGIDSATGTWELIGTVPNNPSDTIYGEDNLNVINEQILSDYGLSVTINQVARPGDNQQLGNGYITSDIKFADSSLPWLAGVPSSQGDSSFFNWIRSGNASPISLSNPCTYNDYKIDTTSNYAFLLSDFSLTKSTWAPYDLAAAFYFEHRDNGAQCPFTIAYSRSSQLDTLHALQSVDVVFTPDKSKWTRCVVLEEQEDPLLAQGHVAKLGVRSHESWNKENNGDNPVYSTDPQDTGMSWFPGYAINEETGERLNIAFGEDSHLISDNGGDMLWNPTSTILNPYDGTVIYGGKHYVYVFGTRYDSDAAFKAAIKGPASAKVAGAFSKIQWVGKPTLNPLMKLTSLDQGLIPTVTRLRFRVTRPYAAYIADSSAATLAINNNNGQPFYTFNTTNLAPTPASDVANKKGLLDSIFVVPNPYYGYSGYEQTRLDTKVRIINLPPKTTVYIYALDGALVRTLTKSDPTTSYLDWDLMNSSGLPIASGMYLMDVKADGIGETVLRWFGAMRPIDITTY